MMTGDTPQATKARFERLLIEITLLLGAPETSTSKPGRYLLNTDAGIRNGQGAIGLVLSDPDDRLVAMHSEKITLTKGTPAVQTLEYSALIKGLEFAQKRGITKLRVYVDNELVVDQINGRSGVRNETLKELREKALKLLKVFSDQKKTPFVYWVPRERNKLADALVARELSQPAD